MPKASVQGWLWLSGRIALLLGFGALPASGSEAAAPPVQPRDIAIRVEAGAIYLSEGGGAFRQLSITDAAQLRRLEQLIQDRGGSISQGRTRLAGSGGAGFHWAPAGSADRDTVPRSNKSKSTVRQRAPDAPPADAAGGKPGKTAPAAKG